MRPDKIFIFVNDKRTSLSALAAMHKASITTLDARGCTALTAIDAPAARTLDAHGCTALTAIDAPAAEWLDASGCTALTAMFSAGCDSRDYHFFTYPIAGVDRVFAGCRNFSLSEARSHWGHNGESDRPDCLALVEKIAAHLAARDALR